MLKLLIVEDSPADYALLAARLRRSGLELDMLRVEDAAELQKALNEQHWDAVISDHNLPTFSSGEALQIVKKRDPDLPFLIVSGAIGEEVAVESMLAGADDYIIKGHFTRLIPALERSLREAKSRRAKRQAELELARTHDSLNAIFSAAPVGLFSLDRSYMITMWSPATEQMTGISAAECVGKKLNELNQANWIHALTLPLAAALSGETIHDIALSLDYHNDKKLLLSAAPLSGTPPLGCIVALSDVSSLKQTEARLRESERRLRELTAHVERVREQERAEIAREFHDDLGAIVTRIRADILLAKRRAHEVGLNNLLDQTEPLVQDLGQAISRIARALRPPILDYGIIAALEWQAKDFEQRTGIKVSLQTNEEELKLELEQASSIFRVFQESLTNIHKHAKATLVEVEIFCNRHSLTLEIQDNGIGLSKDALVKPASFGLRGMMERMHNLGGWMDISSGSNGGTTVMICLPRQRNPNKSSIQSDTHIEQRSHDFPDNEKQS